MQDRIKIADITTAHEGARNLSDAGVIYLDQLNNFSDEFLLKHRRVGKIMVHRIRRKYVEIYNTPLKEEDILI